MRRSFVIITLLVAGAFVMAVSASASRSEPRDLAFEWIGSTAAGQADYGNCPNPQFVCSLYHPGSVATRWCAYGDCFDMGYGEEMRVVAADESGPFPKQWFIWHEGNMTAASCQLTRSGNKARVQIPATAIRCRAELQTTNHLYHEHFASNPATGCLGWVECRAY